MSLNFKANDNTQNLTQGWYQQYDYPTLVDDYAVLKWPASSGSGDEHSTEYRCPAVPAKSSKTYFGNGNFGRIYLDNSSPTLTLYRNSKSYYCSKSISRSSKISVSYDPDCTDATGSVATQYFYPEDGETVTIAANGFTRPGYKFLYWQNHSSSVGGGGITTTTYNPGDTYNGVGMTEYSSLTCYAVWQAYDIPAGTYSPSVFESMISNFISVNGSRTVANSFTATVNNQTIEVNAGDNIYYVEGGSGANHRYVVFKHKFTISSSDWPRAIPNYAVIGIGASSVSIESRKSCFKNFGVYIVYRWDGHCFKDYEINDSIEYPITISNDVDFN